MAECLSCKSISGEKRISPVDTIFEGKYWIVEHAYPVAICGWLVVVLKRHLENTADLTYSEESELMKLQRRFTLILHDVINCEKVYRVYFAESKNFKHVHFHLIPVTPGLTDEYRGTNVFKLIGNKKFPHILQSEAVQIYKKIKEFL